MVVVVVVVVVAPATVVVVVPEVVVVVAPAAVVVVVPDVVVVVVAGAAVVVVQQGLVGKVGVRSMPNLASWLLLHSRQVPGRAGGGTYSMPTVSRMAPITVKGSDWPLTIGWRSQTSSTPNLIPAANPEPDCRRSRGWGNQYKQRKANRMEAAVLEENGFICF